MGEEDDRPPGRDWRPPHGYSQVVRWDGSAVVKTFRPETRDRRDVESAALRHVGAVVPVPRLLDGGEPDSIRMDYVAGILGQQWVAQGRAATDPDRIDRHITLMAQCGRVLRVLHDLDVAQLRPVLAGDGSVLVHGDFAPYNLIVDPESGSIRAIVDWELAHLGSVVEDLAWLEWNMRIWYSPQPGVLEALYHGYGRLPPWPSRHEAMLGKVREAVERTQRPSYPSAEVRDRWADQLARTLEFEETVG